MAKRFLCNEMQRETNMTGQPAKRAMSVVTACVTQVTSGDTARLHVWPLSRRDLSCTPTLVLPRLAAPLSHTYPVAAEKKMAIKNFYTPASEEKEMTNQQRNLVDTCFEEGKFDSAISLLNNLCHPSIKPSP